MAIQYCQALFFFYLIDQAKDIDVVSRRFGGKGGKVLPFQRDVLTPVVSLNMRLKKWQIALGKSELEILTCA